MSNEADRKVWWTADKGQAYSSIFDYVSAVERRQARIFDKFVKLAALYDPNSIRSDLTRGGTTDSLGLVTENVIASNVDTVTAAVAATDVRARFMTDDADWSHQRTARHLEWYAEGLSTLLDLDEKCRQAFKAAALKGTGLIQVYIDGFNELRAELVPVDEIVVDELECRDSKPKQMHRRRSVDREALKSQFPRYAKVIEAAQSGANRTWRMWAGYRPVENNEVVIIESWRLAQGKQDRPGYLPGRHVISIDGASILDEKYHKTFFPMARIVWSEPVCGWYGISGAERIAGHQRALNKRNWQIDRQLDQLAVPTTYVRMADANLSVKTTNRLGSIAVIKGDIPQTVIPPAVSGETYQSRETLKASAFEEFGVSRMAAQSTKPAGLDSGVALREYRDQTTQRFSLQEKAFERLKLEAIVLILDCCKELGADAPEVLRRTKFGAKRIKWGDVDMGDVRISIAAASTLSRTPAGRMQTVLEWAQAGVISQDEARRLLRHPDLERSMSIYTEALEDIEHTIEAIEDGEILMPEPYQNLKLGVWRCQMEYLKIRNDGAPEEILESLRQWITQAAYILSGGAAAPANSNALPGAAPAAPGQVTINGPADMGAAPPMDAAPQAALSPQAMQLMAR